VLVGAAGIVLAGNGGALGAKVQRLQEAYIDERQIAALTRPGSPRAADPHEEPLDEVADQEVPVSGEPKLSCDEGSRPRPVLIGEADVARVSELGGDSGPGAELRSWLQTRRFRIDVGTCPRCGRESGPGT
jgi:hypothetical protein